MENSLEKDLSRTLSPEQAMLITSRCTIRFSRVSYMVALARILDLNISYDTYYQVLQIRHEKDDKGKMESVLLTIKGYGDVPFNSSWFCAYRSK